MPALFLPILPTMKRIDHATLRQIPILRVAESLGMELQRTGYQTWNMKDPENPRENSSLAIFENTNSWHRFSGKEQGGVHRGSVIDLVMHMRECVFRDSCEFLSSRFL